MGDTPLRSSLLFALHDLSLWLDKAGVRYVLIGGMAVSFLGRPRTTGDIDVLVILKDGDWEGFLAKASQYGFSPRLDDCLQFARQSRVFLMRHDATGVPVDVVLAGIPLEEAMVAHGMSRQLEGTTVLLPTAEDLIIMKSVANRPRDIADIEGLLDAHEAIDWDYVLRWTGEFADVLATPEIRETIVRFRALREAKNGHV